MAYNFDQVFAADPANPANIAQNAAITIYAPGDPTMTPLTLTDPSGGALTNPIQVNANGFGSAFQHATLDRVAWSGGGFTGFFTSYEGMKDEAVAARTAAEAAATNAAAAATADLETRISLGEFEGPAGPLTNLTVGVVEATPGNPLTDEIIAAEVTSGTATTAALNATYATASALTPKLDKAGTKTDTSAGLFDWQNNAASGYLLHLRTGPSSVGAGVIGIGTDLGSGNGLLISHKNTGTGVVATGQPGSGKIAEFTSRGSGSGFWVNVQAGGGAVQVNARDGAGYPDGASTSGSTTFTSATAAFVAGDVGKSIVQLTSRGDTDPFGSIPAGTTIASVTNATTVVLSQAATATGTNVMFNIVGRIPSTTQALFRVMETDLLTELVKFTRGGATFNTADVASTPVRVNAKTGQTADIFQVYDGSAVKVFSLAANGGITSGVIANFSNGALLGASPMTVSTYSSHASIKAGRLGAGSGDNAQFLGSGSTALSRFNKDGYFMTTKSAAPADADLGTGELALWVDTTAGAAKLMIKAKDSAGAVKTGSVTLA